MKLIDDSYISYLNLEHRVDRRERMENSLTALGLHAWRTPGGQAYAGDQERVRVMRERTPGTIGCYVGQCAIMQEALKLGLHAFVMEDDVVFCDDFWDRLKIIGWFLDARPWDIFWFGGTYHLNPPVWHKDDLGRDVERTNNDRILKTYGIWSTYAYLVNRESIQKVLHGLERVLPTSVGIDTSMIQLQPEWETFCFAPGCVKQYDSWSDIGNDMTYFSNFDKLGPHWYQERMEHFNPGMYNWAEAQ